MKLDHLTLQNFRNYTQKDLTFNPELTVVVGENTSGKTNLLEAIYLLATGDSFRAERIEEMVKWGQDVAHITAQVTEAAKTDKSEATTLAVSLTRGILNGQQIPKRKYAVNGVAKRKKDFTGLVTVVIFRPEDLDLIVGSPGRRRAYLDNVLSQVDAHYSRSLASYAKALTRRNKLLDLIREGEANRTVLTFWDQLLIRDGTILTEKRRHFIDSLTVQHGLGRDLRVVYDFSAISEKRLKEYEREEVAAGFTLVGPHKDDFWVEKKAGEQIKDLSTYGSRGEQRLAIIWLKLNELTYSLQSTGQIPLLLLDDILSELDEDNRQLIWQLVTGDSDSTPQTVITTTELSTSMKTTKSYQINLNHSV